MPAAIAEIPNGSVTSPRGFTAAAAHAGLNPDGAPDVALLVSATSCATAGVFTKNALRAAPVTYDAELLAERPGRMRAVAMNARVANACTGAEGLAAARAMALAAVADGEGASKLGVIHVVGAVSETAARDVGRAIARSALVKTAIYGADPNWGRILAAAGAAGVALAVDRLTLEVAADGDWLTLASGGATAHPDVARARAIFQQKTIRLRVDLGLGRAEAVVWTCDLTPDYVRINADYTS